MYVQRWVIFFPIMKTYYADGGWSRWPGAKLFTDPQEAGQHLDNMEVAHPNDRKYFQIIDVWVKEPCPTPPTV